MERTAVDLFVDRGFAEVSVDDVSAAAGISQRTFFRYFGSKDDVLLGYRRRLDQRLLEALQARPIDEKPVAALRRAFLDTSHVPPGDREAVLVRARAVASAPALLARSRGEQMGEIDALATELASRMRTGIGDNRARLVAAVMSAAAVTAWDIWVEGTGLDDPATHIAAALDLVERGLGDLDR
ncbi:TetR family transcriptional regulator [Rhodococcoides yunnanense]|uniref:TetR family transcriptional regulator n=1 Tax=Rhodococcoides yunnanense TaxID=278209 RepID=UPI003FA72583